MSDALNHRFQAQRLRLHAGSKSLRLLNVSRSRSCPAMPAAIAITKMITGPLSPARLTTPDPDTARPVPSQFEQPRRRPVMHRHRCNHSSPVFRPAERDAAPHASANPVAVTATATAITKASVASHARRGRGSRHLVQLRHAGDRGRTAPNSSPQPGPPRIDGVASTYNRGGAARRGHGGRHEMAVAAADRADRSTMPQTP